MNAYLYGGRLLFVAKEAVYKAVATLDQIFLDHQDVEVDLAKRQAVVRNGRTVDLHFCIVDYPDRQWVVNDTTVTSTGPLGALFCTLYGYTVPFTTAELKSLYKNHGDYVSGVVHETNDLLKNRFLQSWNADTIKQNAGESSIR